MKLDTLLLNSQLSMMPDYTKATEAMGFDGLLTSEINSDPFLTMTMAAEHSQQMRLGTAIAVTFARSPTTLAHIAWDLARFSEGRFVLGLGPQVKAHNERRFGVKWEKPVRKMRETIEAIRAVWDSWQNGTRLKYEGEFFKLNLMTPFFSGEPLDYPRPPIYISAVNRLMLLLAGKACDGVYLHVFHTLDYLDEFALPALEEGLARTGRQRQDLTICAPSFIVPTDDPQPASHFEMYVRQQLAFYLSTPAYQVVPEMHGWQDITAKLTQMARRGEWEQMPALITDEMLDAFAVSGKWGDLPGQIKQKYGDRIDRMSYYWPFVPGQSDEGWRATIAAFKD